MKGAEILEGCMGGRPTSQTNGGRSQRGGSTFQVHTQNARQLEGEPVQSPAALWVRTST